MRASAVRLQPRVAGKRVMNLHRYFNPIVYVTLHPERLSVQDLDSGETVAGPPLMAIANPTGTRLQVIGVGEEAKLAAARQRAEIINPFQHPRTLLSDFIIAEQLIKAFLRKLYDKRLFRPAPTMVIHPRVDPEGGFTMIEVRAMRELGIGSGARKVIVWQGRVLTREELLRLEFPSGGKVLDRTK